MNPDRSSSVAATFVGVAIGLSTAAAQELGAPRVVWIAAAVAGGVSFIVALALYVFQGGGWAPGEWPSPSRVRSPSRLSARWMLALQRDFAAGIAAVGLIGIGVYAVVGINLSPDEKPTVIVCIDSGSATAKVRRSYLPDLKAVVHQAADRRATLYAAGCGFNATGTVNWPVRKKFSTQSGGRARRAEVAFQVEEVFADVRRLAETQSESGVSPLGEDLAVMAQQCEQAGGNCTLYVFTSGEWNDGVLKVKDGIGRGERREYLRSYRSQLEGLGGSQVNFVGVGFGTAMGPARLDEAHELAQQMVEDAEGQMGSWTTRL